MFLTKLYPGSSFFSGPATKRGKGKDRATKKKILFLELKNLRSRGGKALVAGPLKITFFAASLYKVANPEQFFLALYDNLLLNHKTRTLSIDLSLSLMDNFIDP